MIGRALSNSRSVARPFALRGAYRGFSSAMEVLKTKPMHPTFGSIVVGTESGKPLTPELIREPEIGKQLRRIWEQSGVLIIRDMESMTGEDLEAISGHFGIVSRKVDSGRDKFALPGAPGVLRIGNVRDENGDLVCKPSTAKGGATALSASGSFQYRPEDRQPVWHTDGTFQKVPPVGSAFFCRQAPPVGGATCFSDAVAFWESLSEEEREKLEALECVCSLAHHDAKLSKGVSGYPTQTEEQRLANPPQRTPVALAHPVTGRKAFYGMNSSTCAVVPKGQELPKEELDRLEIEGVEDESVKILRDLLPRATSEKFAIAWQWRVGDLVVWDNRSTMHAATGYDQERHIREMWRTSIYPDSVSSHL
mmetsp:Transcript_87399/g.182900  ORF Transcript_87399/g.182900 Transcript_87399/m.182900 type:complete len:365 (+) Transcript_87399:160-1254(+)